jgi:acetoin:2,6-dichlorophenolindophenol oxidoreductase subunit alpha
MWHDETCIEGVCLNVTEPQENPLVPNKKLKQMYLAMVEARILDEHIAKSQGKAKTRLGSTRNQEASRVSTSIELIPGDLVSDSQPGVVMDHLLGADIKLLSKRLSGLLSQKADHTEATKQLPWIEDIEDRLSLAAGAALAFRSLKQPNLVVAYVPHHQARGGSWRRLLSLTAQLELPIIFVVLPDQPGGKNSDSIGRISAKARACGLPGIPVDASDVVALYRVTQEAIGRIRIGGGAVVIECGTLPGHGKLPDPLQAMKSFLIEKKISPAAWLEQAGDDFRKKLQRLPKKQSKINKLQK